MRKVARVVFLLMVMIALAAVVPQFGGTCSDPVPTGGKPCGG